MPLNVFRIAGTFSTYGLDKLIKKLANMQNSGFFASRLHLHLATQDGAAQR